MWYIMLSNTGCLNFVYCLIKKNERNFLEVVLFALTGKVLLQSGNTEQ
jgi:hypothetical protein